MSYMTILVILFSSDLSNNPYTNYSKLCFWNPSNREFKIKIWVSSRWNVHAFSLFFIWVGLMVLFCNLRVCSSYCFRFNSFGYLFRWPSLVSLTKQKKMHETTTPSTISSNKCESHILEHNILSSNFLQQLHSSVNQRSPSSH